jgi:hypothetical protein
VGGPAQPGGRPPAVTRVRRERPLHPPSTIWLSIAFLFFSLGAGAALAAVTVPADAPVTGPELWIVTAGFAALTVTCIAANWDVNRGRRVAEFQIEEEEVA